MKKNSLLTVTGVLIALMAFVGCSERMISFSFGETVKVYKTQCGSSEKDMIKSLLMKSVLGRTAFKNIKNDKSDDFGISYGFVVNNIKSISSEFDQTSVVPKSVIYDSRNKLLSTNEIGSGYAEISYTNRIFVGEKLEKSTYSIKAPFIAYKSTPNTYKIKFINKLEVNVDKNNNVPMFLSYEIAKQDAMTIFGFNQNSVSSIVPDFEYSTIGIGTVRCNKFLGSEIKEKSLSDLNTKDNLARGGKIESTGNISDLNIGDEPIIQDVSVILDGGQKIKVSKELPDRRSQRFHNGDRVFVFVDENGRKFLEKTR